MYYIVTMAVLSSLSYRVTLVRRESRDLLELLASRFGPITFFAYTLYTPGPQRTVESGRVGNYLQHK